MLEPGWFFLPDNGILSKSDLKILTVGFTSLLEQNFELEVAFQNAPKCFRATASTAEQDLDRDGCFSFSSVPGFIQPKGLSGMPLVRIQSLDCPMCVCITAVS